MSKSIKSLWGIKSNITALPASPVWTINATNGETGARFRIKGAEIGDYKIYYADKPDLDLAEAMAISAAFPFGIGPFIIDTTSLKWKKKEEWNENTKEEDCECPYKRIHLYDGGLYDNLGIEPFFDIGKQEIKKHAQIDRLFVSDASSPMSEEPIPDIFKIFRFMRLVEIVMNQVRSLRTRAFANYIIKNNNAGAYFQLGSNAQCKISQYANNNPEKARELLKDKWLSDRQVKRAAEYKTTLKKVRKEIFDLIVKNGYETAKWNLSLFA